MLYGLSAAWVCDQCGNRLFGAGVDLDSLGTEDINYGGIVCWTCAKEIASHAKDS